MDWAEASEAQWRAHVPVFINSFNQLTYLRDCVDWFGLHGFRNVTVIEQGSSYPPMRDYLTSEAFRSRATLLKLRRNIGPRKAVRRAALRTGIDAPFIFTDPDLGLPAPPAADFVTRMFAMGRKYDVTKVGLALDVFDADRVDQHRPLGPGKTIHSVYKRFFDDPLEDGVWRANTDTTFFLYVPRPEPRVRDILSSQPRIPGIRLGGAGFVADHRPWLFDPGMPEAEERFYAETTSAVSTFYGRGENRAETRITPGGGAPGDRVA